MNNPSQPSLVEQAGGAPVLEEILTDFYGRVFGDAMIGFHFRNADRERLIAKELEFTLVMLGAEVPYTGKPMREAHAPHPIFGGQFMRRLKILEETLLDHDVPVAVREAWLKHSMELIDQITGNAPDECHPEG